MKRLVVVGVVVSIALGATACGSSSDTVRSDNGPAITATVGGGAGGKSGTTVATDASPKDAPSIFMSSPVEIPPGTPGELSIAVQGAPTGTYSSTVPVVVRNNTDEALTQLEVSGPARGADGALVGTGSSQGFQPATLQPGEWAMGYVFFSNQLPPGTTVDLTATGKSPDQYTSIFPDLPVKIGEANLVQDQYSPNVVGILQNTSDETLFATSVMLMCFDGSTPTTARSGYPDSTADLAPGTSSSFDVTLLSEESCPTFALAASGTPKS
jgi:hypothetical protein